MVVLPYKTAQLQLTSEAINKQHKHKHTNKQTHKQTNNTNKNKQTNRTLTFDARMTSRRRKMLTKSRKRSRECQIKSSFPWLNFSTISCVSNSTKPQNRSRPKQSSNCGACVCVCVCVCGGRGWINNCQYNLNQLQGIGEEDERGTGKRK